MSTSHEMREFNSPMRSIPDRKNKKRNKVSSPLDQSPSTRQPRKGDVFELFTVKSNQPRTRSDSQDTSELSDDVFVKAKPVSVSSPSKSETKSYREKINERFKSVKEKAGKYTRKAGVFKEAAEKILLEKVKRESSDIDAELESMRNRLKLGKTPENRELYEFFCSEKCQEAIEEADNENFETTDDLSDKVDVVFALPTQMRATLKSSEEALLFKPKAEIVDTVDKIGTEEPRFLEEEGFYVPPAPKVPTQHILILEQRLSRDDKKWFNCDGKLNIVENPCQKNSYRPHLKHLPVSEIATYRPATVDDSECEEIVVVKENLLQLQISSLKFTHHPLFSLEHVLAEKLKKLFQEYEGSVARKEFLRLTGRLEGLRQVLRRLDEVSSQSGDHSDKEETKAEAYRRDIKTLQEQVFEEGKKERDRIKAILQTWKAIKKTRETNGHSNTSVRLVIKKEKTDHEAEKESFEQAFEDTYEEYLSYNREKPRRKRQDVDDIREELLERFKESFRAPGEPILQFVLADDHEVTKNVESSKESNRRNVVSSTRITLKIVCNKMEVCKTKSASLGDDFVCHFDETVSMQPINVPKSITIEIIEQPKSLIRRTIGELTIKIPPRSVAKDDWKGAKFEKAEIVHYKHEGVGSGIKVEEVVRGLGVESGDDEELNTGGVLKYSLAWDAPVLDEEGSPEYARRIVEGIIDKNGVVDAEKLSEWMHRHKPDPQDPRNAILYEYSAYVTNSLDCGEDATFASPKKNYFRLNQHLEGWKFCDQKIIEDNLRLKVLQLRNKNEPEFDRMTVPNRIKEIPRDILADYERRVASERENLTVEEEDDDEDEIEKKRSRGRKLLKQIHIRVFQKCKNSQNNLTFEDVVDEKFLPQLEKLIKSTVTGFVSWFRWRPLKPLPQLKTSQDSKLEDYELRNQARVVVTVISGLNIPVRLSNKSEEVAAFVEAEYNGFTARTATGQGPHPTWNEMLTLPLEPTHLDYLNPNSLNGTITLNIFDEGDTVLSKFSGMKSRDWLGCVQIPLSAVCFNGIQGMFKVKIPQLLLGYKGKNLETSKSARGGSHSSQQTYLNLHIMMEPNVPKLNPSVEELPCAEVPYIKEHALRWNENYNLNFPNRKFSVFAIDVNATTSCIVRYVKPLEPPQINVEGFDVTPEQCARFVSLIPFTDCNQFYKNIWLSVDRFLHFMIGSVVDHAVALTCYLLALKLEAWLLLGFGVPHGSSAFVLVKKYDNNQVANYYVYDVVLGEKINLTDAFCPLQKVYCVVNEHNVWANVQRNDDIATIRLDLTRRSDWLPLFNNQISAPTNSIHGKLTYLPQSATDELEIIIDRKIRKKIAKLRQLDRTVWNHNVSNVFKSILGSFEKTEMYGKSNSEAMEKIADCMATFKMRGLIFNSPFTDVSSMVKTVKSFGLHLEEEDNTQFASAVYLRSYPNHVLTTWVFVAAIQIKNASS